MTTSEKVRELPAKLTPGEKAQTLQWLVRDLTRTRILVWVLVQARKLGSSEAEILQAYPSLRAEDLIDAWAYYDAHKEEIEAQIAENEAA